MEPSISLYRKIRKLEAKGYLRRVEDEQDGRSKKVIALPSARAIHMESRDLDSQFSDILTEGFSQEELESLDRLLTIMADRAKKLLTDSGSGGYEK